MLKYLVPREGWDERKLRYQSLEKAWKRQRRSSLRAGILAANNGVKPMTDAERLSRLFDKSIRERMIKSFRRSKRGNLYYKRKGTTYVVHRRNGVGVFVWSIKSGLTSFHSIVCYSTESEALEELVKVMRRKALQR